MEFQPFPKIPRLFRDIVITEKLDGTNSSILIIDKELVKDRPANIVGETGADQGNYFFLAGSRNRWVTPQADNYGFARWVSENTHKLWQLGPGHHFGEWWGQGIQRNYGLKEKRFSLFNTHRWGVHDENGQQKFFEKLGCYVVPQLYEGPFDMGEGYMFKAPVVNLMLLELERGGSKAAPGWMKPEGIIIFHKAGDHLYKVLLENDEKPKSVLRPENGIVNGEVAFI